MRILFASLTLALASLSVPSFAQEQEPEPVADRTINLGVYGNDACPKSSGDEIVVCARRPESERYRIPKRLRKGEEQSERSWASRNEELEAASRHTMPNSCSVVGSFGQSGCYQQMISQWYKERRARKRAN